LIQLIEHSRELKFLVGFFYFSGWRELFEAIKDREDLTIKILVGLEVNLIQLQEWCLMAVSLREKFLLIYTIKNMQHFL
jgi:hypothetical protein